ncbi:hypothetical protein A6F68_02875 [Tsuneonella dongtanensis]|uniref:Glycosyltransferase RgtA/B/C/D-like domain-containing protein n=1 Tax=Tsuneonella dongtanensis TaxID=692370 RepID=A0A1B2AGT0_9SPHN|nr:hypothetical protein [Tsuneonella dongtanensis]ANY21363.1 hypothetical protein A6F68_02875 [Tsuneonella dongtanensis]
MTSIVQSIRRSRRIRGIRAKVTRRIRGADRRLANPRTWALAIAGLAALQLALILTHRAHVDEYQSIQLTVQAPDIPTLLDWLRYEGHPPLWYFILRGLAYFMEPMTTLKVAAIGCAVAAHAAILFGSPFTRAEKLLLCTSEFIMFEYMTISRSLSLGVAAIVIAMGTWRRRWVWLPIAILPMCDFLFGVFSVAFVAMKLKERDIWVPGLALWAISGAAAAWSVIPAADMEPAIALLAPFQSFAQWLFTMGVLLVPFQGAVIPQWDAAPNFLVASWGGVAFLYWAWRETEREALYRIILFAFVLLTAVFSQLVYQLSARHLMLIAILFIALKWRMRARGERPGPAFRLWLAVASACGLAVAAISFVWPFDTAHLAAREIERLGLRDKHWTVFTVNRAQGISAMTGMEFERTELHCMQSFVRWNKYSDLETPRQVARYFRRMGVLRGKHYLLTELNLDPIRDDILKPVAFIPRGYDGLSFRIYQVGPNEPERPVSLPPCVPGRRPFTRLP